MTTIEAYRVCDDLNEQVARLLNATKHKIDWRFDIHGNCLGGRCKNTSKFTDIIRLNRDLLNYPEALKQIALHELCHAYDYDRSHHGKPWQRIALKVGTAFGTHIRRQGCDDKAWAEHMEEGWQAKKARLDKRPIVGYLVNDEKGYKHPCRGNKAKFMIAGWYHKNPDGTTFPLKFVEA